MATYYALPTLTSWNSSSNTGWSSTSGGAQLASGYPSSSGDTVIFDSNSGPARSIAIGSGLVVGSIICTGAPMTLDNSSSGATLTIYPAVGGVVDLSGFVKVCPISIQSLTAGSIYLKGGSCAIFSIAVSNSNPTIVLSGDIVLNQNLVLHNGGFNANGYNVTCNELTDSNATASGGSINFGSGTWTFTQVNTNSPCISLNYLTWSNYGTTTFKINTGFACTFDATRLGVGNKLWIANGGSGTSISVGTNTIGTFQIDSGTLVLYAGSTYTANSWIVSGAQSSLVVIKTNSSTGTAGIKSGVAGATVRFILCNLTNIAFSNGVFTALSCVDGGGNSGITFYKLRPNFLSYF